MDKIEEILLQSLGKEFLKNLRILTWTLIINQVMSVLTYNVDILK